MGYMRLDNIKFWESVNLVYSNPSMHAGLTYMLISRVHHLVGFPEARDAALVKPPSILTRAEQFGIGPKRSLSAFLRTVGLDVEARKATVQQWCTKGTGLPAQ